MPEMKRYGQNSAITNNLPWPHLKPFASVLCKIESANSPNSDLSTTCWTALYQPTTSNASLPQLPALPKSENNYTSPLTPSMGSLYCRWMKPRVPIPSSILRLDFLRGARWEGSPFAVQPWPLSHNHPIHCNRSHALLNTLRTRLFFNLNLKCHGVGNNGTVIHQHGLL